MAPVLPEPVRQPVGLQCLIALEVQDALRVLLTGGVTLLDGQSVSHRCVHDARVVPVCLLHCAGL